MASEWKTASYSRRGWKSRYSLTTNDNGNGQARSNSDSNNSMSAKTPMVTAAIEPQYQMPQVIRFPSGFDNNNNNNSNNNNTAGESSSGYYRGGGIVSGYRGRNYRGTSSYRGGSNYRGRGRGGRGNGVSRGRYPHHPSSYHSSSSSPFYRREGDTTQQQEGQQSATRTIMSFDPTKTNVPEDLKVGDYFRPLRGTCFYAYTAEDCRSRDNEDEEHACKRQHDNLGRAIMEKTNLFLCLTKHCGQIFEVTPETPKNCRKCCERWLKENGRSFPTKPAIAVERPSSGNHGNYGDYGNDDDNNHMECTNDGNDNNRVSDDHDNNENAMDEQSIEDQIEERAVQIAYLN